MGSDRSAAGQPTVGLRLTLALVGALACACAPDDGAAGLPTECAEAEARVGELVCAHRLSGAAEWQRLSRPTEAIDQRRISRYFVPAIDAARLPTMVVNINAYELHYQVLTEAFAERFAGLTPREYIALITDPNKRELFAGSLIEFVDGRFAFAVWDDETPAGTPDCATFSRVYQALNQAMSWVTLAITPANSYQREVLRSCALPVYDPPPPVAYEAYTVATAFGYVRRRTLAQLKDAALSDALSWQDVVVAEAAPLDIEPVVAGVVTGSRQGELSHLNVRSAARGTPNCYSFNAYQALAAWEGKLVKLSCGDGKLGIEAATIEQAEAWWTSFRPKPLNVPTPDLAHQALAELTSLETAQASARRTNVARYGAKGANLATLYQRIDQAYQLPGFLVPFFYYRRFIETTRWKSPSAVEETFLQTLERWLAEPSFVSDAAVRRAKLAALREGIEAAGCDAQLVSSLVKEIERVFGSAQTMVRFRSSSNAEDALGFSGAGLYSSTSACAADSSDSDESGPSRCDAKQKSERTICRALTRVWASTWNFKAFEERAWYGIDQHRVAMGVLVNARTADERANIVAFSGNPNQADDPRYLVNAQLGELAVVAAEPGVFPERVLLTIVAGEVSEILRARGSTELPAGEHVLDDAQLKALGRTLSAIVSVYPVDDAQVGDRVLLDTEWKLTQQGQLIIKQVRPFLLH
ncbi:MAG: hypothetical protein H6707_20010 [Deltaproteobacteria bacterium]|nr:hypothetical protein [Deltaproteobacteria bacterium]